MLLRASHPTRLRAYDASPRRDPTGTTATRVRYERDLVGRFKRVRSAIVRAVGTNDVFGLGIVRDAAPRAAGVPPPGAFKFFRSQDKVASFMSWLRQSEDEGILGIQQGTPLSTAAQTSWQNTYIDTAYQKGIRDAGIKLRGVVPSSTGPLIGQFNSPIHADAVGLIYTRSYSDLKGITDVMDQQISRILAQGLAEGRGPMDVARQLADRVDKIGITRARVLARTEIISAHAESTLNTYEEAGIAGVEIEAEFTTAGDDAVCPDCEALEGQVFTLSEARGMIPVHPNCRCAFLPIVG